VKLYISSKQKNEGIKFFILFYFLIQLWMSFFNVIRKHTITEYILEDLIVRHKIQVIKKTNFYENHIFFSLFMSI